MRIIDIDGRSADHLGCYGYPWLMAPAIGRIAARGVRFEDYCCSSSRCLPPRTTPASGRFGIRSGVPLNADADAEFRIRETADSWVAEQRAKPDRVGDPIETVLRGRGDS